MPHLPGSGCGEEASRGMCDPLLDTGVAEPVHQPLAEQVDMVYGGEWGREQHGGNCAVPRLRLQVALAAFHESEQLLGTCCALRKGEYLH